MSRLAALVAVLGAAVAGCGNEAITRGGEVPSSTLTVYSLLPDPQSAAGGDLVNGEKLALAQAGGRAGRFAVTFASLAEGTGGRRADVASATRSVIGDPQAIAVIGGLDTAGTRTSAPLFNEAGYLQVALGAGYPGLTRRGLPDEPERYQPAAQPTLMRLVGDDDQQAAALVAAAVDPRPRTLAAASGEPAAGSSKATRIAIEQEPGAEADALARAVRRQARRLGARVIADPARADALVYSGTDPANAAGVADGWAREAPHARIVLPEALVRAGVAARLGDAARRRAVLVSSAPATGGSAAERAFAADFRRRFGRAPGAYAAVGYEAMRSVLAALDRAGGRANVRQRVIDAFLSAPARPSLLGPLRVDRAGDRIAPTFTISRP